MVASPADRRRVETTRPSCPERDSAAAHLAGATVRRDAGAAGLIRAPRLRLGFLTYVLARGRFRELIATEPAMREALLATLAAEVRRLTHHVEELHFLDITGRLASRLARLAGESGACPTSTA